MEDQVSAMTIDPFPFLESFPPATHLYYFTQESSIPIEYFKDLRGGMLSLDVSGIAGLCETLKVMPNASLSLDRHGHFAADFLS